MNVTSDYVIKDLSRVFNASTKHWVKITNATSVPMKGYDGNYIVDVSYHFSFTYSNGKVNAGDTTIRFIVGEGTNGRQKPCLGIAAIGSVPNNSTAAATK